MLRTVIERGGFWILRGLFLLTLTPGAAAQSTAALEGTVSDTSGAMVGMARIAARNAATGEERAVLSDSAGIYMIPSLPIGAYSVTVTAPGMQKMVANNVLLEVGRTVQQNFTLPEV